MLEIRFTTRDNNAWVDMVFAPLFILIAFAFLYRAGLAGGGAWVFWFLIFYGLVGFFGGLVRWKLSRVDKVCCRIDEDGLRFYNFVWYKGWKWSQVDFIAWRDVETITTQTWAIMFLPRSWIKRSFRYVLQQKAINLMPIIVYNFVDKDSGEIIEAVKKLAPNLEIKLE